MTATVRNLDETLPAVPKPRAPRGKAAPSKAPRTARPRAERIALDDASDHLRGRGKALREQTGAWNTSSLYTFTAARIDALRDSPRTNAVSAVTQMQAQASLLVWELGQILNDLQSINEKEK